MKTITFKYTLSDEQIKTIAHGLGYTDTTTKISETGEWVTIDNPTTPEQFITERISQLVEEKITPIFLQETAAKLDAQKIEIGNTIQSAINAQKEVLVEDVIEPAEPTE